MRLAPDLFFAQAFPALLDSCEGDNSSKQSKHCASTYYQKVTFSRISSIFNTPFIFHT
jgi:hypothetical protein